MVKALVQQGSVLIKISFFGMLMIQRLPDRQFIFQEGICRRGDLLEGQIGQIIQLPFQGRLIALGRPAEQEKGKKQAQSYFHVELFFHFVQMQFIALFFQGLAKCVRSHLPG